MLTPHFAGPTYESWPKRVRFAYENIARVERDERPESVVPELADVPLRAARYANFALGETDGLA